MNALTGEERWQYDTKTDGNSNEFHSEAIFNEGLIITGSDDRNPGGIGHIYAFEADTGTVRWKYDVNIGIPGKLNMNGTQIYAIDFDETLHVLDINSGKLLHKIEGKKEKEEGYRFPSSPTIWGDNLFLAYRDGRVQAINTKNWEQLWQRILPSKVSSDSVLYNKNLFIAADDKSIYELNIQNGKIIRRIETSAVGRWKLLAANERIFSLQWNDSVCTGLKAIDLKTAKEIWSQQPPENSEWVTFRPMLWKNLILVGSDEGHLMAYDTVTGTRVWTIKLNGALRSFGAGSALIYAGATNGNLYAVSPPN